LKKKVKIITIPLNVDFCNPDDLAKVVEESIALTPPLGTYFIATRHADSKYLQPIQLLVFSNNNDELATYPHVKGTLPISKETVQQWIDSGMPDSAEVDMLYWCKNGGFSFSM
jgi:hypothetical protein